jgi:hypothetical protein
VAVADDVWVVGDPQGWLEPLTRVLGGIGLLDSDAEWSGGGATLAVAGDLVDRGPDGFGVIALLMRLQSQGADVRVVIGNHDLLLLAARRFGDEMHSEWLESGGVGSDLERLTDAQVDWLCALPAMIQVDDALVQHADALFYQEYGSTLDAVNAEFQRVLAGDNLAEWRHLLDQFGEHRAFFGDDGETNLAEYLWTFGGQRLVHGHTPIARMLSLAPESITEAYVYRDGRCVNVDPGIYLGGPGFAFRLR